MVRTDRYSSVYDGPEVDEPYGLETDPHELQTLTAYESVWTELAERLGDWVERTSDHVDVARDRRRCGSGG